VSSRDSSLNWLFSVITKGAIEEEAENEQIGDLEQQ